MFIQVIQGRCSRQDELRAVLDRWPEELGPTAVGWLGGTYGFTDDGLFIGVVRFEDRESAMANSELRRMRPEIIGATLALEPDGSFTETVAFTDEASARSGEGQEPPDDVRAELAYALADARFHDLRHPWFGSP